MPEATLIPIQVNFLRQRKRELSKVQLTDQKYAKWLAGVFATVMVASLLVLGVDLFFGYRLNRVLALQKDLEGEITQQKNREAEYLILAKKIETIKELIGGRTKNRQAIEFFTTLFSTPEISVKEVSFEGKSQLQFYLNIRNVFAMDQAVKQLASEQIRSQFAAVTVSDLSRAQAGEYTLQVTVILDDQKKVAAGAATEEVPEQE